MNRRASGILLHISSLPSRYGIGDWGQAAYEFADFLAGAKQSYWQILPLNPTELAYDNSPYHSISAFAMNPWLISPDLLLNEGLLVKEEVESVPDSPEGKVDYGMVVKYKGGLLASAYERFKERKEGEGYRKFCEGHAEWLEDFALFVSLKGHFQGQVWSEWPPELRDREPAALERMRQELHEAMEREMFLQYVCDQEWFSLKRYCNERGIDIIGDLPIYVEYDSVDVWRNPELFKLDEERQPYVVAGVPPDYYSETGQLWGNPVYRWEALKETGYEWWMRRIERNLRLCDVLRIDHFRGLVAYWEVPAGEKTAIHGQWVEAPVDDFFTQLNRRFPFLPIIAEDLGVITPDVTEAMRRFDIPGMKVLLFAFGEDMPRNPYIAHNVVQDCLLYTGTHDNNTVRGWFEKEASEGERRRVFQYLGREVGVEELPWELIRLAMMSVANTVVIPLQDVLGLGEEARMNRPASGEGNWRWRVSGKQLVPELVERLRSVTELYGRTS